MMLLVDSACGMYAWHRLAINYPLFVNDGNGMESLTDWLFRRADMDGETIETVFNPDNEQSYETIEYLEFHNGLYVLNGESGEHWRVEQIEGDIWAIAPNDVWCEETNTWVEGCNNV